MPAVIQPINIHVGRGDLWVGVTPPTTPPVPLTGGLPATGRFVGATIGTANFIYRPVTFDIRTQQDTGIAGYVITEEDVRLEFEIGELTYENLRDFMIGALDQGTYVSMGGIVIPPTQSILMTAPKRTGANAYHEVMLYSSVFSEDRTFPFQRQGWTNVRVIARGQSTLSRQQGDRLAFFHPNVISA